MPDIQTIEQETTFTASAQLLDEDGVALPGATLTAIVLEVLETRLGTVCRSKRNADNVNDVTISAGGLITWLGQVEDSRIANPDTQFGRLEKHVAEFEFAYGVGLGASGTDLLDTLLDDNTVTLTATGHGLDGTDIDEEHIFILAAEDVGGLNLNGRWRVASVVDPNTLTIEHTCPASSTATGGGAVSVWINPRVGMARIEFPVRRNRRDC